MKTPLRHFARRPPAPPEPQPETGGEYDGLGANRPASLHALDKLRTRILNRLLIVASALGIIAYLANLPASLQKIGLALAASPAQTSESTRLILALVLYTLAIVGLVISAATGRSTDASALPKAGGPESQTTISRSYRLRANLLLGILFLVGAAALLSDGLYGSGRLFLLTLPVLSALLLDRRGLLIGIGLSLLTVLLTGSLMILGRIPAPQLAPGYGNDSLLSWFIATANFTLLALAASISIAVLVDGLLENQRSLSTLASTIESERDQLENRIHLRTRDLQRRLNQIRTAAEITRTISQHLDIAEILPQVCELMAERLKLYYVGVFLIETPVASANESSTAIASSSIQDQTGTRPARTHWAVLAAGSGEAGRHMLAEGHRLAVGGESMIGWATAYGQPRIALDVGSELVPGSTAGRFENPHLPETRSELALPIISEGAVLGAISIQSNQPAAFDQDDITVLQGVADGLASAIRNGRLFAEVQARLDEIHLLHRAYLEQAWGEALQAHGQTLAYTYSIGSGTGRGEEERSTPPTNISGAGEASRTSGTQAETAAGAEEGHWMQIPILLRDQVIGTISVEGAALNTQQSDSQEAVPRPPAGGARQIGWTEEEIAFVENIAAQAGLALENARLLETSKRQAEQERVAARIAGRLWASSDVDAILRTALQELAGALHASEGSIRLEIRE